jgi:hypothetical protein
MVVPIVVPVVVPVVVPRIVVVPIPGATAAYDDAGTPARVPAGTMPAGVPPATSAGILNGLGAIEVVGRRVKRTGRSDGRSVGAISGG